MKLRQLIHILCDSTPISTSRNKTRRLNDDVKTDVSKELKLIEILRAKGNSICENTAKQLDKMLKKYENDMDSYLSSLSKIWDEAFDKLYSIKDRGFGFKWAEKALYRISDPENDYNIPISSNWYKTVDGTSWNNIGEKHPEIEKILKKATDKYNALVKSAPKDSDYTPYTIRDLDEFDTPYGRDRIIEKYSRKELSDVDKKLDREYEMLTKILQRAKVQIGDFKNKSLSQIKQEIEKALAKK